MSIFILVVNEGKLSVPGDNQRCPNYGYSTRHGSFNTYDKYHCSKLGHGVVMNIWNIDAWQRQKYLTPAVSCYFMSLSDKVSYLLDSIMLLSQNIVNMIPTVKFERNNLPFTTEDNSYMRIQLKHVWTYTAVLCNKYMYIVPIIFFNNMMLHPCKFSSCHDI